MQQYRPRETAPATGTYIAIDSSGEVLNAGVLCEKGERLPWLYLADANPVGYILASKETAAKTR